MYFDLESPVCVTEFGKVTQPCGNRHNGRSLPDNLLVYCLSGSMRIGPLNDTRTLVPGDIFILPARTFYKSDFSDGCTYYFIHFSAKEAAKQERVLTVSLGAILPAGSYHYIYGNESGSIVEISNHTKNVGCEKIDLIFSKIASLEPNFNAAHKLLIDNLLRELLISISSELLEKKFTNRNLAKMTEYIKTSYSDSISLSSLAKRFELSESYISRLFREEFNARPSDYINKVRIERAKDLLIHTNMSITDISESVGYSSLYYFSRIFKSNTGISPRDFRDGNI